jgi:hypothetical protein
MADSEAGKMKPRPKESSGMIRNWHKNPMAGPMGRRRTSLIT